MKTSERELVVRALNGIGFIDKEQLVYNRCDMIELLEALSNRYDLHLRPDSGITYHGYNLISDEKAIILRYYPPNFWITYPHGKAERHLIDIHDPNFLDALDDLVKKSVGSSWRLR